jgi:predicted Zn finger-like uncharacterized protein
MILTCPECATSYFVDDLRIPRLGRMVKCTSCGHRWRAHQERVEPERVPPEDDLLVEGPPVAAPPEDDLEFVTAPVTPIRKPETKKKPSAAATIAAAVLAGLVVVGGAVVLLRQQIAGMIPATAPMFAAIGLPVNTLGLVLEGVKSKPLLQGGRPVWSVTGAVRNVRDEPVAAPPIRLTLLDKAGKPVATLVADALNARVPPGAVRYFAITMPDPPAGAAELEIGFELPAEGAASHAVAAPVAAPAAEPAEAQPLPPDSPHALEKNDH